MDTTAREVIIALKARGFSDGDIAKAISSSRATICKIRNARYHYTGKIILSRLVMLAQLNHAILSERPPVPPAVTPPTEKPVQQTVYLPVDLRRWLRVHAASTERRVSDIVAEAVQEFRAKHQGALEE
jgi:hypothetical protein